MKKNYQKPALVQIKSSCCTVILQGSVNVSSEGFVPDGDYEGTLIDD